MSGERGASEAAHGAGAASLDELTRVTREYAEYSSQSFGLAGLVAVAAFAINLTASCFGTAPWVSVSRVLGSMAWFGVLALARRSYQRAGAVISPARRVRSLLFLVYVGTALATVDLAFRAPRDSDDALYLSAYFAALLAVPGLFAVASRVLRGYADSLIGVALLLLPFGLPDTPDWRSPGFDQAQVRALGKAATIGIGMLVSCVLVVVAVVGVRQHLAWRRLGRRLASLREEVR